MHALRQPERNLDVLRAEVFRILGRSSVGRAAGSDSAGRQFDPDRPIQVLLGRSSVLSSGFDPAGRTSPSYRPSPWGVGKWLSHRFLVPVFVGSNPTSPAKQTVSLPASRERSRTASDNNPANGRGTSGGRHSDGVGKVISHISDFVREDSNSSWPDPAPRRSGLSFFIGARRLLALGFEPDGRGFDSLRPIHKRKKPQPFPVGALNAAGASVVATSRRRPGRQRHP